MRIVRAVVLAFLAVAAPSLAVAQDRDVVVRGDASRVEIERILNEDNLDTSSSGPRDIVDTITGIARGHAPDDFWQAYQAHVAAWRRLAEASEQAPGRENGESNFAPTEMTEAQLEVEATFREVERIARRYGARLPVPPGNILPTV